MFDIINTTNSKAWNLIKNIRTLKNEGQTFDEIVEV
jgi:hypothetical protein